MYYRSEGSNQSQRLGQFSEQYTSYQQASKPNQFPAPYIQLRSLVVRVATRQLGVMIRYNSSPEQHALMQSQRMTFFRYKSKEWDLSIMPLYERFLCRANVIVWSPRDLIVHSTCSQRCYRYISLSSYADQHLLVTPYQTTYTNEASNIPL